MKEKCNDTNPLQLSGTSQGQRVLPSLAPSSAPIDGRQAADWILFAREYGRYLQFYNALNIPDGSWQALMQKDISVVLATLVAQEMPLYQAYQRGLYDQILALPDDPAHTVQGRQFLEAVFDLLFSYIYLLDQQYQSLPAGSDVQTALGGMIKGDLSVSVDCLVKYYSLVVTAGLVDPVTSSTPIDVLPPNTVMIHPAPYLLTAALTNPIWKVSSPLIVPPIPTTGSPTVLMQIKVLVTSNLFNSVVNTILGGVGTFSTYASTALNSTLTNYPSHPPHYALYLTFLQIFQEAIAHLDGFTGVHLLFYYQRVLRLSPQPASGDEVHLVLMLQKNVPYLFIPKGTTVQAGKDSSGKALYYATKADFTINQAKVAALQSIRYVSGTDSQGSFATVYDSPVANSDDGDGAALSSPDKSWYPFGNLQTIKETAALGFAIASADLYLKEGQRTITVTLSFPNRPNLSNTTLQNAFQVQLTGVKGWITAPDLAVTLKRSGNYVQYIISLTGKSPAVVGYSAKLNKVFIGCFLVGYSRVDLQACKLEYSIVSPK